MLGRRRWENNYYRGGDDDGLIDCAALGVPVGLAPKMARLVGAPIVMASHVGPISMSTPALPGVPFSTQMVGQTQICEREAPSWPGSATRTARATSRQSSHSLQPKPLDEIPALFWFLNMGPSEKVAWNLANPHDTIKYRDEAARPPPLATRGRKLLVVVDCRLEHVVRDDEVAAGSAFHSPADPSSAAAMVVSYRYDKFGWTTRSSQFTSHGCCRSPTRCSTSAAWPSSWATSQGCSFPNGSLGKSV